MLPVWSTSHQAILPLTVLNFIALSKEAQSKIYTDIHANASTALSIIWDPDTAESTKVTG